MIQRKGLFQALRGFSARGKQRAGVVGKDVDVLVASADLISQRADVGHQRQIGDVTVDPPGAARRGGCLDDRPDALGLASHELNLGPSPREFIAAARPMPRVAPVSTTTTTEPTVPAAAARARFRTAPPIDFPSSARASA